MAGVYEDQLRRMLGPVARALGPELLARVAFVGGSTTGVLITDPFTRESVRFTEDIDLIVHVRGFAQWTQLRSTLHARGFCESPEDDVVCRMRLGRLVVDVMPDDESILGFTNRWYSDALRTAQMHTLEPGLEIRVLTPVYFLATKLEAWLGRGNNDPITSQDIEDIINLVDGREVVVNEIATAEIPVRDYIAQQIGVLLGNAAFEYAVQGNIRNQGRAAIVLDRLEQLSRLAPS